MKLIRRLLKLVLASAILGAVVFVCTDAFSRTWRGFVVGQMAKEGLHLDFDRLVLNPFSGIVAREVKVFSSADRQQVLAAVDRLNLDFDFGKLLESEIVLEGLEMSDAKVTLPMDPEAQSPTFITLENFSARAYLREGRLELQKAEGNLSGLLVSITGDLTLPEKKQANPEDNTPERPSTLQRMQGLRDHQVRVKRGLDWLKRFKTQKAPRLTLEVHGAMDRIAEMNARLYFDAEGLSYGTHVVKALRAEAEYNAGLVDLTRLHLKDRLGELNASATWRMGAEDMRFHLTSSADLPGLAEAFLDNDNLREVVFYEPPHLALDGVLHIGGPFAGHKRPVHVTGQLDCGRFSTRGEVFDGLAARIGVAPEGVYIRDLLLRHETGSLSAQAMVHEEQGCRYQAVLRMDPRVFLPFAKMKQTREIISRFEFSPNSSIHFEITGSGPEPDPQKCRNVGRGDLRNFKYRGMYLENLTADVEFQGPIQHYRNLKLKRPEGVAEAAYVNVDDAEKWVRLTGVKSGVDPVALVGVFNPRIADIVARYRLPQDTSVQLDGVIHYRNGVLNDFRVKFRHPSGTGRYALFGDDYQIAAPVGDLLFKGHTLNFDVNGRLFAGPLSAKGSVDLTPGTNNDFKVTVVAEKFPWVVFSKKLNFEGVRVVSASKGRSTSFDVKSTLLGGGFSLVGKMDEGSSNYSGEIRVDTMSLKRITSIYAKGDDSVGDITGHFKFTGRLNDWSVLKGGGAAMIVNGDLGSVPILGPLTPMLGAILPKKISGYNIAKEASCTFDVADGFILTKNFEALTSAFKIVMDGRIDFIRDALDLNAQVRVRGLPGIVFLPFSELLEFRGTGPVSDPKWSSRLLKPGAGGGNRPEPTAAELKEAERIAGPRGIIPQLPKKPPASIFTRPGGR